MSEFVLTKLSCSSILFLASHLVLSSPSSFTMPAPTKPASEQPKEVNPLNPKGLKPCCACPVTKSARDDCFIKYNSDEAAIKCADLIDQHKACMRGYGFKV
ncbi:unnamed protein product [Cutaneotrichosporon oleaginosum]